MGSRRRAQPAVRPISAKSRKAAGDRGRTWLVDPFSSGISFAGWRELAGATLMWKPTTPDYEALWVWQPQTWLLQQAHGHVSARAVPG